MIVGSIRCPGTQPCLATQMRDQMALEASIPSRAICAQIALSAWGANRSRRWKRPPPLTPANSARSSLPGDCNMARWIPAPPAISRKNPGDLRELGDHTKMSRNDRPVLESRLRHCWLPLEPTRSSTSAESRKTVARFVRYHPSRRWIRSPH